MSRAPRLASLPPLLPPRPRLESAAHELELAIKLADARAWLSGERGPMLEYRREWRRDRALSALAQP